jgi:hypothetical protein
MERLDSMTNAQSQLGSLLLAGGPFPLTPALSLWEREDRRQLVGKARRAGIIERRTQLLPLPKGEGWGEGKARVQTGGAVINRS